jgi:hypothetical protein
VQIGGGGWFFGAAIVAAVIFGGCQDGGGVSRPIRPAAAASSPATDAWRLAMASHVIGADEDRDGLDDGVEDALAESFAPVVYHGPLETSFPVAVDWWLARTHLSVRSGRGLPDRRVTDGPLSQSSLVNVSTIASGDVGRLTSDGTRSRLKSTSFFLEDVGVEFRRGQLDTRGWVTYVHSYGNRRGGVTLQYWRAYAWNGARVGPIDLGHGGDWEGIAVHLNSRLLPERVTYLEHSGIVDQTNHVRWEGGHPVIWSEEGGHSSYPTGPPEGPARSVRQETWTAGRVVWFDGVERGKSGGLLNVGEKTSPRNGQVFITYSGLWGSIGRLFITSGYWGPAFNETGAQCSDGTEAYGRGLRYRVGLASCHRVLIAAWCDEMDSAALNPEVECYSSRDVP